MNKRRLNSAARRFAPRFARRFAALSRALCLILLASLLLPCALAGCKSAAPDAPAGAPAGAPGQDGDPDALSLLCDGKWDCALLAGQGQAGGEYEKALENLISLMRATFGGAPLLLRRQENGKIVDDAAAAAPAEIPEKLIIFGGNALLSEKERGMISSLLPSGEGICAFASGERLILFSSSDDLCADLVSMISGYIKKDKNGNFSPERSLKLSRPFAPADPKLTDGYDFTLPVLSVNTLNGKDVTTRKVYVGAKVSLCNTYENYAFENAAAEIRGRGNGTWTAAQKKPYKLKFENKTDLLGTAHAPDREWVLMSNPFDFTNVRNATAFTLAKEVFDRIDYSSNFAFVNLFLNGKYRGIYMVCETNEPSSGKVQITEDPESPSASDFFIQLDDYAKTDGSVRGTDYFEIEGKCFKIESDHNSVSRCMYVYYRFRDTFAAIRSGDREEVEKYIDLPSCVDMYLLHEYLKNTDVGWSSFYMVLRSDGKLYFTAPWDFDLSSGNDHRVDDHSYKNIYVGADYKMKQSSPLYYLLMENPWFQSLAKERWLEISERAERSAVTFANRTYARYAADYAYDMTLRMSDRSSSVREKNFSSSRDPEKVAADNIEYLTTWLENRRQWLDNWFSDSVK